MRSLIRGLKHLCYAIALLIAVACVTEVGLRTRRSYDKALAVEASGGAWSDRIVPSSDCYQQLKPLLSVTTPGEADHNVTFRTNSLGLRSPEIRVPKPAGTYRVICLGDETTLAAHLREDAAYPARLQTYLQQFTELNVEVINAGLPGGCPLTNQALLRNRLMGLQADLVLLHWDDSDPGDDRSVRKHAYFEGESLVAVMHPSYSMGQGNLLCRLSGEFAILDCLSESVCQRWDTPDAADSTQSPPADALVLQQAVSPLAEIRELAAGNYGEFVVTTIDGPEAADPAAVLLNETATQEELRLFRTGISAGGSGHELTPEQHDGYARSQASYIVRNLPGVWTQPRQQAPSGRMQPLATRPRDGSG